LPLSQWALHFYDRVSYHHYNSLTLENAQGKDLVRDLGPHNMTMLLKHHGSLTCGKTIWEAAFYTYHLHMACRTQCRLLAMNQKIDDIPREVCEKSVNNLLQFEADLGRRDWEAWQRLLERRKK